MSDVKLGSGTYGQVTKVIVDGVALARKVAVSPQFVEIEVLKGVQHPCLVKLVKYAVEIDPESGDKLYVTYFPLYQPVTPPTKPEKLDEFITNILYDILSALMELQSKGWCHRDLKPSNIMYDPSTERYVLIDVGLCQKDNSPYTHTHFTCSEAYRPPIMINYPGRYPMSIPVDVYALALSIFCIISGDDDMDSMSGERYIRKNIPSKHINDDLLELLFGMMSLDMTLDDAYINILQIKGIERPSSGDSNESDESLIYTSLTAKSTFSYKVRAENGKRLYKLIFHILHNLNLVKRCLNYSIMLGLKYLQENPNTKIPLLASACAFLGMEFVMCERYYATNIMDFLSSDNNFSWKDIRNHAEQVIRTVGGVTGLYETPELDDLLAESEDYDYDEFYENVYDVIKTYRLNQ